MLSAREKIAEELKGQHTDLPIPEEWADTRAFLEDVIGEPVVMAGGALRDLDHGKPIKDIDVFFHAASYEKCKHLFGLIGRALHDEIICDPVDIAGDDVSGVGSFVLDGDEWNMVGLRYPCTNESVADRFDFGICQIAWDGDRIYRSKDYQKDVQNRTFTLTPIRGGERKDVSRALVRYERLTQKYKGYRLVLPEKWRGHDPYL